MRTLLMYGIISTKFQLIIHKFRILKLSVFFIIFGILNYFDTVGKLINVIRKQN